MKRSSSSSQIQIPCPEHAGSPITHVCMNPTCLVPLCSKCIKEHNNLHKSESSYPETELIEDVRKVCSKKIQESLIHFEKEVERMQSLSSIESVNTDALQKIQASKKALFELLENHYRELETQLVKGLSVSEIQKKTPQNYKAFSKMKTYVEKLETYYLAIQKNQFVKYLQPIFNTDFDEELYKLKELYEFEKQDKKTLGPEVLINPSLLQDFQKMLKLYAQIDIKPDSLTERQLNMSPVSPSKRNLIANKRREQGTFKITVPNYYEKDIYKRYLHFFQHKSKNLFLLDIDACETSGTYEFERIELDIKFKIPRWHRSVGTPFGEIYLAGGVDVDKSDVKLDKAYVYDFNNNSLIEIMNMKCGRSGHALVYLQGYLYAIGGFSHSKEFTKHCERYNIRNDTWEQIAHLNVGSNNPCACGFNDKYIFKFGGKIDDVRLCNYVERYNPDIDKWTIIQYELNGDVLQNAASSLFLSSSACCQVNEKDIFIFGGTHADYSNKSNASFVLHMEKDARKDDENPYAYAITHYNEYILPVAEGFWNNQATIVDGKVYSMQNIQNEKNVSIVYLDRRRLLRFHPESGWTILN